MKVGVPFTWGALLTSPGPGPPPGRSTPTAAGWERGAEVWPQVTPRPLDLHVHPRLAVPARGQRVASPRCRTRRSTSAPRPTPTRRGAQVMKSGWARAGGFGLRVGHLHDRRRARRTPSSSTASWSTSPPSAAPSRSTACSTSRSTSPTSRCGCARSSPTTTRTASPISWSTSTARSASPTPARTSASCATRRRPPTCSATGCATRASCPMEQAIRKLTGLQADLFGFADRGYLRPGACADVVVFDPATVAPGPMRRVRDFPADAERLTADQPVGMHHVVVNGTPIQVDGEPHRRRHRRPGGAAVGPSVSDASGDAPGRHRGGDQRRQPRRAAHARRDQRAPRWRASTPAPRSCTTTSTSSAPPTRPRPATARAGTRCSRRGPTRCSTRRSTASARWRSGTRTSRRSPSTAGCASA